MKIINVTTAPVTKAEALKIIKKHLSIYDRVPAFGDDGRIPREDRKYKNLRKLHEYQRRVLLQLNSGTWFRMLTLSEEWGIELVSRAQIGIASNILETYPTFPVQHLCTLFNTTAIEQMNTHAAILCPGYTEDHYGKWKELKLQLNEYIDFIASLLLELNGEEVDGEEVDDEEVDDEEEDEEEENGMVAVSD
ncbi:hypothetical protein PCE1_004647 [Barthelona sp. PCE]